MRKGSGLPGIKGLAIRFMLVKARSLSMKVSPSKTDSTEMKEPKSSARYESSESIPRQRRVRSQTASPSVGLTTFFSSAIHISSFLCARGQLLRRRPPSPLT
jgi:hypothetical protein